MRGSLPGHPRGRLSVQVLRLLEPPLDMGPGRLDGLADGNRPGHPVGPREPCPPFREPTGTGHVALGGQRRGADEHPVPLVARQLVRSADPFEFPAQRGAFGPFQVGVEFLDQRRERPRPQHGVTGALREGERLARRRPYARHLGVGQLGGVRAQQPAP
ncbi:hypothetical protein ACGFNX_07905 [Streptomyces sp. NPDC048723]|uniref:hypothetical protein n=1 Tax=Streptomyces sp. NPDC048723 TaxID=3365589 RepID=UPI003713D6FA